MKNISFRNDVLPLKDVLFRLALRITQNRAEAEDVVQDTLIKVWQRRESWETIDSIEAFSLTVCRNLALDHIALKEHANASLDDDGTETRARQQADSEQNPLERVALKDRVALVRTLIDHLPEKQRTCIQLRDFEGKAYKEIATIMGISEEQVKVNIFRARQAIKQKFKTFDNYGL